MKYDTRVSASMTTPPAQAEPATNSVHIKFVTRYYGSSGGGIGKYEESIFPHLASQSEVELAPIQPVPVPWWLVSTGGRLRRDLQAVATNHPCFIPRDKTRQQLVHISNEVLALSLLFYQGPAVVTVHHLPPIWESDFRAEAGREWFFYLLALLGLRRASRIIVDSRWTRNEIQRKIHFPANRIDVVPLAVDHQRFCPTEIGGDLIQKYGLGSGPYVLYVGGFESRKNLPVLFRAFAILRQKMPTAELILIGPPHRGASNGLVTGIPNDNCHFLGYVPEEDLAKIYNLATVFVMPSKLEGFGLPVLEAMACGCPVIASSEAALPELMADAGILFDPDDASQLADSIFHVLAQSTIRYQMAERSLERAKGFSWRRTAELTINAYQRVLTTGE